jgi:hypothetical protein
MVETCESVGTTVAEPAPLTEDQTKLVAGGLLAAGFLVGCPTCTSGGNPTLLDAFRGVVNPDPVAQLGGVAKVSLGG